MAVTWTKDQQKVLDVRGKNVLVSAAAGSGKTAVLVERIIKMVVEDEVDIDRLLVVTFTNAAAGEMRERILKALEKKAKEEPDNEHIQRQSAYIHNARITTIDSFCLNIVRQYFNAIDIDPSFNIGDDGELKLLREDVMKELLEKRYEEADEAFIEFVDAYSSNRSDEKIEELINKLYTFSMSYPYPSEWLDENVKHYESSDMEKHEWYKYISQEIEELIRYLISQTDRAIELALSEDGPFTYEEALRSDREFLQNVIEERGYDERVKLLSGYKAVALSRKKLPEATDDNKKEQIKAVRNEIKKEIKTFSSKYYAFDLETVSEDMKTCAGHVEVLTGLTKEFIRMFGEAKREKNIIDFNDMEHLALEILTERSDDGSVMPSVIAKEIAEDICEIMIDEYQDSNLVQETILNAVSGAVFGKNNIFMVGDVKQSIYKFRLARPELFLEKYDTYSLDDKHDDKRITLSKNFRSREEILNGANLIFSQIMSKNLGGIEYDEDNALYLGAEYDDYGMDNSIEIMVADTSDAKDEELENRELEALMVANRIKEMVRSGYVVRDRSTGEKRKIRYSDIAILLRSFGAYGEAYNDILSANGIPVKCQAGTGYFDTFEVEMVLNMLLVIDNPRQDIPLAAVMKNIFLFSDEELAELKMHKASDDDRNEETLMKDKECFWDYVCAAENGKAKDFVKTVNEYRNIVPYTSIYELIENILNTTGFGYFISSMKAGEIRRANLEMLKEKAVSFENTSYTGLFNFVRYIEKLKKYSVEQGEADRTGGGDYVTLMTIHKSKGLEYPIVFVGAMCKQFNKLDTRGAIVMHHELGVGLNYLDRKSGIKANTLIKESIGRRIEKENIAEELRIFYVALTRAKEKLILAGNGNIEAKIKKYIYLKNEEETLIPATTVFKAADYMEWTIMSLIRHRSFADVFKEMNEGIPFSGSLFEHPASFKINMCTPQTLVGESVNRYIEAANERAVYEKWNTKHIYDADIREKLSELYEYEYPHKSDLELKGKVSVSDIKHMFMKMYDEETHIEESEIKGFSTDDKPMPAFLSGESMMSGTMRGTAYHRIFELLECSVFDKLEDDKEILKEIDRQLNVMKKSGKAPKEYFESVDKRKVLKFIRSDTGKRMIRAAVNNLLYREKQFVIGVTADNVKPEYSKNERVLVQGIIDAYFIEDGHIVIVDYKTDNIKNLKDLYARYASQLDYYAMALEMITGKKVKEKVLYSVKLDKEYKF